MGNETQDKRVLEWLQEHKTITSQEAFRHLGVTRLSAVIYRLKHKQGYDIESYAIHPRNRYGSRCNCAEYHLIEKENE